MRYVYCATIQYPEGKVHEEHETDLLRVTQLLHYETKNKNKTMEKLLDLKRFGWISTKDGIIECRKN